MSRDKKRSRPDDTTDHPFAEAGRRMYATAKRLFPIARSITGPGFRETLSILEEITGPMTRHRIPTGAKVFDWTVPKEWTIRDAWIKDPQGRKVVDFKRCNLHVVGYSAPVRRRMPLRELQEHLHSIPEQLEAVPYLTSFYKERWGFCLSHRARRKLRTGTYEVCVDSELKPGHVVLGEVTLPGTSRREILFSTYCCHPSMANNELSGPIVAAYLALELRARPRRFTYRFLFMPETIGAISYLSRFGRRLVRSLEAGYVLTCVGDPGDFTYQRSRRGGTAADRAAEHVLRHMRIPHRVLEFTATGSDERQYCSPGFDLPVGSLMRTMYGLYPEYHTSLDDLSVITPAALAGSLEAYRRLAETLEANETLRTTMPYGEPQLGKRGLYPTMALEKVPVQRIQDILRLQNFCDGSRDLLAVADRMNRPIWELRPVADRLVSAGLLKVVRARGEYSSAEKN